MKAKRYCEIHQGYAMPFRDDSNEKGISLEDGDNPLILSIISDKTTRQGRIMEV